VNLDFASLDDLAAKLRTALGLTSIVTAMFASSPIGQGRPNGHKSYRAAVWRETDERRCGILPFVFDPAFEVSRYVEWALDVPMLFLVDVDGQYHPADDFPFRRFMREGWHGRFPNLRDWEIHMSTLFPEVRLKRTIELRGADGPPLSWVAGAGALWRGILDDDGARAAAWSLVAGWSVEDRLRLRAEVPRVGLSASVRGLGLGDAAVELCRIARSGLAALPGGAEDQELLDPIEAYAIDGRCPADDMLEALVRLGGDPVRLAEAWQLQR
jgi:glutamate--cysteine ligase